METDKGNLEFNKLRIEVLKMMADMEHDAEQRSHWKRQQFYYICTVALASVAMLTAAIFSKGG